MGYEETTASYISRISELNHQLQQKVMNLEQQLIDNENRIALMAAIIYAGHSARHDDADLAYCVKVAQAITKEVGKEAEKIKGEL